MTFFEALKANEFKRVKLNDDSNPWEVGELIEAFNEFSLDVNVCSQNKWQIAEETRELWVIFDKDGTAMIDLYGKEDSINYAKQIGCSSVALYREVPGTREEVKE
jgi:hypothetical protein